MGSTYGRIGERLGGEPLGGDWWEARR